jgi:hypothetical protein
MVENIGNYDTWPPYDPVANVESDYKRYLFKYLKEYPQGNELDFIVQEISKCEKKLEELLNKKNLPEGYLKPAKYLLEFTLFELNRKKDAAQPTKKSSQNLVNGRQLNLQERFLIANRLFGIEGTLRKLNIPELKKYQILANVLNCHPDNARDLMNGTYNGKPRDLTEYFDEIGLTE